MDNIKDLWDPFLKDYKVLVYQRQLLNKIFLCKELNLLHKHTFMSKHHYSLDSIHDTNLPKYCDILKGGLSISMLTTLKHMAVHKFQFVYMSFQYL